MRFSVWQTDTYVVSSRFTACCTQCFINDYAWLAGLSTITGGAGADRLTGGLGNDQFVFTATDQGTDVITDFSISGGTGTDAISITNDAFGITSNNLIQKGKVMDMNAADSNDIVILTDTELPGNITGVLVNTIDTMALFFNTAESHVEVWYDNDWNDSSNREHLATLDNINDIAEMTNFTSANFVVV